MTWGLKERLRIDTKGVNMKNIIIQGGIRRNQKEPGGRNQKKMK
jgi:hypothetical protein